MSADKARQAALLAEVKLAERKLAKARDAVAPLEARAKAELLAGRREQALQVALKLEEQKQAIAAAERQVAVAKAAFARAQEQDRELKGALQRKEVADGLGKIADTFNAMDAADDILAQLERDTALNEAKAEMAFERARSDAPPPSRAEDILAELEAPEAKQKSAEDILREFEEGSGA